ncbi:Calx-beta domain-containing protein [Actinokineospora auranticolor]|nr:Calx-beta domain-containing protein [Actinokineospora auranticolor]
MRAMVLAAAVVVAALPVVPAYASGSGCAPASVAVGDYRQYEGTGAGTTTFSFSVSVTAPPGCAASGSVDYTTDPGTATPGVDYTPTSGTLTWNGTTDTKTVSVTIARDAAPEYEETFAVRLHSPQGLVIADNLGVGQIIDDDRPPLDTSLDGGKICWRSQGTAEIGLHTSAPARAPITIHYRTIQVGDGKPGYYPVRDGVVTIPVGETRGVAKVRLFTDEQLPDEQFVLEIFNPSAGTIGLSKVPVTVRSRG